MAEKKKKQYQDKPIKFSSNFYLTFEVQRLDFLQLFVTKCYLKQLSGGDFPRFTLYYKTTFHSILKTHERDKLLCVWWYT